MPGPVTVMYGAPSTGGASRTAFSKMNLLGFSPPFTF